jgi:hypothetical protein
VSAITKKGSDLNAPNKKAAALTAKQQDILAKRDAAAKIKAAKVAQKKQQQIDAQAALAKKQALLFDMNAIELVAALKGKLSADERLRAQLQLDLLTGNDEEATKLSQQLAMAQDSTGKLAEYLRTLPDAKNPFQAWDQYIKDIQTKLNALVMPNFQAGTANNGTANIFTAPAPSQGNTSTQFPQTVLGGIVLPSTNASSAASAMPSDGTVSYNQTTGLSYNPNAVQITVSATDELSRAIANSLQVNSLSGIPSSVQRLVSTFG